MPKPKQTPDELAALAVESLRRKSKKTPLEDALAAKGGVKVTQLVRFARTQFNDYHGNLAAWRENRRKYAQEAADVFAHRVRDADDNHGDGHRVIFQIQNESLNFVAGLAEFATAQAEQDLYGGEPWFAAIPVGKSDSVLADTLQKHLQHSFRDGKVVENYSSAITRAGCLGESFTKTTYRIETDHFEQEQMVLHANGKPFMVDGEYVTTDEQAAALDPKPKGKIEWKPIYLKKDEVVHQGVHVCLLHHNDVAFREDAPALDLEYTNFYNVIELTILEAIQKFNLSVDAARKLADEASVKTTTITNDHDRPQTVDSSNVSTLGREEVFGEGETEEYMNRRVRLIEGWVRIDPFGDGKGRRIYIVFTKDGGDEDLVYADYLGNMSPKSELPVHCHVWEEVPGKLYGRGFFSKYASVQTKIDDLCNQVAYRNRMHANPVTAFQPDAMERDEDDTDFEVAPGATIKLKKGKKLADALEFAQIPDLDARSMELLQIHMQMSQTRSGITTAAQGDLSAVPENNTATGIRSLMSRAAVLMKKPVRKLRRSLGRGFSYAVKLHYANFDREEAFTWGEGENVEMLKLTPEQVKDLDIDVRMLLTQEQNQTKLQGAQVAAGLFTQWMGIPEIEKPSARPLFLQAIKALEFEGAEEIIRPAAPTLEDAMMILPPEEQARLQAAMQTEQQMLAQQPTLPAGAVPAEPQTPPQIPQ